MSDSLQPHGLQYIRPPCPSTSPEVCPSSCPFHQWCPLILWHPLLLLPSMSLNIRDFCNELSVHIRWPKYWNFSFSINPSSEYSGFISLKIEWFDLFTLQGTLRSLLQHHSSKASILWRSAFYTVQLSRPYMTTGKNIALTMWTFVGILMSLLFSTPSRFVIVFLPRSKWFSDFMAAVTIRSGFRAQEEEICHYLHLFPFNLPEVIRPDAMILVFFSFLSWLFHSPPSPLSRGS